MNTKIVTVTDGVCPADRAAILQAARILRDGGLVAFPTETVYGLGADGTKEQAAEAIYRAKGRPSDNPLILHVAQPADAAKYAYTCPLFDRLADRFMPGPLTIILPVRSTVPKTVTAGLDTVAIRCPAHPVAHALISAADTAIAAPSANLSGSPSPTCAKYVISDLAGRVDMILDGGACEIGLESTIVKIISDTEAILLRPGGITPEQLQTVIPKLAVASAVTGELAPGQVAESPGMKYKHYAPKTQMILINSDDISRQKYILTHADTCAVLCYHEELSLYNAAIPAARLFDLGPKDDPSVHCNRLFTLLREADKAAAAVIYAPLPKTEGLGLALYNRMIRAAAHQILQL